MNKFKLGQKVVGVCEPGQPYGHTCKGWKGIVVKIHLDGDLFDDWDICVVSLDNPSDEESYPVLSQYFKRLERNRNLPSWF